MKSTKPPRLGEEEEEEEAEEVSEAVGGEQTRRSYTEAQKPEITKVVYECKCSPSHKPHSIQDTVKPKPNKLISSFFVSNLIHYICVS